jgi:hypothetical protein
MHGRICQWFSLVQAFFFYSPGRFLIQALYYLLVFSICSWFSFDGLYVPRNFSISASCHLYFLMSFYRSKSGNNVCTFISVFKSLSLHSVFLDNVVKYVSTFWIFSKSQSPFGFVDFALFFLFFIYFYFNLHYFLLSATFGFSLLFIF